MGRPTTTQLSLATELVEVLGVINEAEERRDEILTSLHDGLQTVPSASRGVAAPQPVPATNAGETPAPAEPVLTPEEAMDIYEAGVEKISAAQGKMIWALLSKEFELDENNAKAVIRGIVAELHSGAKLDSTKDLSKVWATDVIDYLKKHTAKDLEQWIVPF